MPRVQDRHFEDRFWSRIDASGDCWEWTGWTTPEGYGNAAWHGRQQGVHRIAYELLVGPIPAGLQLDHLCRNTRCVNPDHLEPVTVRENVRRGFNPSKRARLVSRCRNGHEYTAENTYLTTRGTRSCRTCHRAGDAVYKQRHPLTPEQRARKTEWQRQRRAAA